MKAQRTVILVTGMLFMCTLMTIALGQGIAEAAYKKPKIIMECGTFHPPGTGDVEALHHFKAIVEKRSNLEIRVNVYYGKTLGGDIATADQTRMGTLHLMIDGLGTMGKYVSKYLAWSIPYAYPDKETLIKSSKGPIGQAIAKEFERKDLKFVGIFTLGYRNLTSNRNAVEPEALKGMKMRLPKYKDWITVWEEFGVLPVAIPAPEMFIALQTGVAEAQENPYTAIHVRKLWEVQKYIILTQHIVDFHVMLMSKKFYDQIPENYREIIWKAAEESLGFATDFVAKKMKVYKQEAIDNGMKIIEPNREAYRKIAIRAVDKIKTQWEPWVYDQLIKETSK